jgi:hypothetical protein
MSCPHATTTTIAWLYGEADEGHALHVAGCPECAAVAEAHEVVLAQVMPVMPRALPASVVGAAPRRRRSSRVWLMGVLAVAAAVLLVVGVVAPPSSTPAPETVTDPGPVAALDMEPASLWSSELEADLLDLDASLDALADELGTL